MRKIPFFNALHCSVHSLIRLPFTLALLLVVIVAALKTSTIGGKLSNSWRRRVGYAPRDLWILEVWRIVTSALVTSGGRSFWQALFLIAMTVGAIEWIAGTLWAVLVFWGVHMATMVIESLLLSGSLVTSGISKNRVIETSRDVGSSAGYFGSLGFALSFLPKRLTILAGSSIGLGLLLVFGLNKRRSSHPSQRLADLAHLIAFPLGWLLGWGNRKKILG
jgi:hypothetical protein